MRNILKQCDREKAINELVRGQRFAKRLRTRLQGWEPASTTVAEPTPPPPFEEAGDVVIIKQLLTCFENTLCIVKNSSSSSSSGHDDERRRKCQEHSGTISTSTGLAKDRRGCYRRFRKTDDSWIQDSSMPMEDGYRWRKYGQKTILNTKYLRDYFRCTHKDDQGCMANKHVQRVAENPALYRTTYFGHHTCTDLLTASQFLPQEDHTAPFSLINFAPQPRSSSSSSNNNNGSNNSSNSSSRSNSSSNSRSSSNDNNNTWSSFFTSSQSSTQQEYNNMNSDRDLPNHDRLISTYNKSPSLSHYLVPTYDQTDVLCTTSSTTTPILKNIDFDDNGRLLFYFRSSSS